MGSVAMFWKSPNLFGSNAKNEGSSLEKLFNGNARFAKFSPSHPDESKERLKELSAGQHPFAVIVCCSDSRVSPELLFDQGVGDLFVIRTAGNLIGPMEMGSIEYAVEHLGARLVVVMGHEKCGAVKAMIEGGHPHGHIRDIVDSLSAEEEIKAVPINDANRLDDCVKANVKHGIHLLKAESEIIREKLAHNELSIVGARYDLDDLKVSVIEQ